MSAKLNWTLTALFLLSLAANLAIRRDPATPNFEILPDMARSVAYASFSPNPVLPGGKTLQTPVPGTLPRGFAPFPYANTPEEAIRAGKELRNPLDATAARTRGAVVFQNFCTPCHGATLRGDGPVAQRGFPAPPNLKSEKSMNLPEGQVFHILTFGQKNMPSYASQLTVRDRWSVISYLRSVQDEARAAVQETKR